MSHYNRPDGTKMTKKSSFELPVDERESYLKSLPAEAGRTQGFSSRVTPLSRWEVISLDYWADPRKTAEWALEMISTIGMARYQREFLRNWKVSTQSPFFPEYLARGGDEAFVRIFKAVGSVTPLVAGLDFGRRRPSCVAMQANPRKTRLYVLREWLPQSIGARAFYQVVAWLFGALGKDNIEAEGLKHILDLERAAAEGKGPKVPWFHGRIPWQRFAGSEALRTQELTSDTEQQRVLDVWQAAGHPLGVWVESVDARVLIMRHLLRPWPANSSPYILIDKWCTNVRAAFSGGYTFVRPTKLNPEPNKPHKDGFYDNVMDALMYGAANIIDIKRPDLGGPEPKVELVPSEEKKEDVKSKGTYSRAEQVVKKPESFSTPFGELATEPGVYNRDEGVWS